MKRKKFLLPLSVPEKASHTPGRPPAGATTDSARRGLVEVVSHTPHSLPSIYKTVKSSHEHASTVNERRRFLARIILPCPFEPNSHLLRGALSEMDRSRPNLFPGDVRSGAAEATRQPLRPMDTLCTALRGGALAGVVSGTPAFTSGDAFALVAGTDAECSEGLRSV